MQRKKVASWIDIVFNSILFAWRFGLWLFFAWFIWTIVNILTCSLLFSEISPLLSFACLVHTQMHMNMSMGIRYVTLCMLVDSLTNIFRKQKPKCPGLVPSNSTHSNRYTFLHLLICYVIAYSSTQSQTNTVCLTCSIFEHGIWANSHNLIWAHMEFMELGESIEIDSAVAQFLCCI